MITTSGKAELVKLITGTGTEFIYVAIGADDTPPTPSDTQLSSELARRLIVPTISGNTITFTATFTAGLGTGIIREIGIFNSSSGGTMLSRVVITDTTKGALDTFIVTWTGTVN